MSENKVFRALEIEEAARLLHENMPESCIIAGGTDLMVQMREGKASGSIIVDISSIGSLSEIEIVQDGIRIGAMVRFSDIVESKTIKSLLPGLWEACRSVGSPQIRNLGTIGGNLANGSPAADSAPPLLAMDSILRIHSVSGTRELPLESFYLGKGKTALEPDEILESIQIPVNTAKPSRLVFEKLGLRNALAISRISAAVYISIGVDNSIDTCRVASGSLGLTPMRETELESWLTGKILSDQVIKEAGERFSSIVEHRLSGRQSMPYKRDAVQGVIKPALYRIYEMTVD